MSRRSCICTRAAVRFSAAFPAHSALPCHCPGPAAVIMSGRDCIGIAKTGSGKTLAFVLPMLRHVKDQPPLAQGDGPVALCMAPTRELVNQVRFSVAEGAFLSVGCLYRSWLMRSWRVRCVRKSASSCPAGTQWGKPHAPSACQRCILVVFRPADRQGGQALCQVGGADLCGGVRRQRRGQPDHGAEARYRDCGVHARPHDRHPG